MNKLLVGNKSDLTTKKVVSFDEGKELAESYGIRFVEASAKSSHNVEKVKSDGVGWGLLLSLLHFDAILTFAPS